MSKAPTPKFWERSPADLGVFMNRYGSALLRRAGQPKEDAPVTVDPGANLCEAYTTRKKPNRICKNSQLQQLLQVLAQKDSAFVRFAQIAGNRASKDPDGWVTQRDLIGMGTLALGFAVNGSQQQALHTLLGLLKSGQLQSVLQDPVQQLQNLDQPCQDLPCKGEEVVDQKGHQGILENINDQRVAQIRVGPSELAFAPVQELRRVQPSRRKVQASRDDLKQALQAQGPEKEPEGLLFPQIRSKVLSCVDQKLKDLDLYGNYELELTGLSHTRYATNGKVMSGLAEVQVRVHTPSGHIARFTIPVAIVGKRIDEPALFTHNREAFTLGQANLDKVLGPWLLNKQSVLNPYDVPPKIINHPDIVINTFTANPHAERGTPGNNYGLKR